MIAENNKRSAPSIGLDAYVCWKSLIGTIWQTVLLFKGSRTDAIL